MSNCTVNDLKAHLIAGGNLGRPLDEPDIATFRLPPGRPSGLARFRLSHTPF